MTMSDASATANRIADRQALSGGAAWLLPAFTCLLAATATMQLLYFMPRSVGIVQKLAGDLPGYVRLLLGIPAWAAAGVAIGFAIAALWQRRSPHRSALLAGLALAANIGLLFCLLGCLSGVVARV
jgi:hypothetical protein